jgi:hypothetical protein
MRANNAEAGLDSVSHRAHIVGMRKYTSDDLAIIQREIEEQSETAQVEWRRVAQEGFHSREERTEFHAANAAASKRFGELLDKRTEIKEALAK